METAHTETIVEKVTAYVKDALGIAPAEETRDVVANPENSDALLPLNINENAPELKLPTLSPTYGDVEQFEPRAFTTKKYATEFNPDAISQEDFD